MSRIPTLSAQEAAALICNGETIGCSGFTSSGAPKAIPQALARRAVEEHEAGRPFQVGVIAGASTGPSLDGLLAEASAIAWRTPFQSNPALRRAINAGKVRFFDLHLSGLAHAIRQGLIGPLHWAIVEASRVDEDGTISLTSSSGVTPTLLRQADRVLIELNRYHPPEVGELHDLYELSDPPGRKAIPLERCGDRIGSSTVRIDRPRIAGIVETNLADKVEEFRPGDAVTQRIGENAAGFLVAEMKAGRIPQSFLPIQAGVGNVSNAVLAALAAHPEVPDFEMFAEVLQDTCVPLIDAGRIRLASTCALTLTPGVMEEVDGRLGDFRHRVVLRPQEISNAPELIRRLGVISLNTALEADLFGNVNSTHIMGSSLVNGIGGSGDFTRNAFLSIFMTPSTAKGGAISAIVPFVTHIDHNEHSVQVIITEHGVADLRCKTPGERARLMVEQCAHPDYRGVLREHYSSLHLGHIPQSLETAFEMHRRYLRTGSMLSG